MSGTDIIEQLGAEQRWNRVKWTEVGQVAALLDGVIVDPAMARRRPSDWWLEQVAAGELAIAARFLAMALPRLEAIGWAAETLEAGGIEAQERVALDAAARWVQIPDDDTRRAAWDAAEMIPEGPARFLGAAIFFSGGSIAPPDCAAVHPPSEACGVAVGATILGTAYRTSDSDAFLRDALATGARIAIGATA